MTLHDAIDKNHFIIDGNQYSDAEIQNMTLDELETLKMRITKKISGISTAIKEKQIDYACGGEKAPKDWYMNRKLALSINQRVLTYVNSLAKKRLKARNSIGDFFLDSAKRILTKDVFQGIYDEAQLEKEALEGGE